ncbi:MAG TPA: DUF465 domain-containing protein [Rhodobiaceae bacterium]|nr:DUF465 domain-containing protein [Rhodobiaceae bacterium]|tara:strand:+ start:668 stop:895 length:228 start_codon:yes stop_codon:yes gene_type:complete
MDMDQARCQAENAEYGEVAMTINARLTSLQRQHRELEDEIRAQQADLSENTLDIWTLKCKKLALKELIDSLRQQA